MPRTQRPIVPEEHLGPITAEELRRMKRKARCDSSPTGAHFFTLTKNEDGVDDGPCKHCHKLHSEVYKKSRRQNKNRKGERKIMANLVTVNDLVKETGADGRIIRRILRKQFGGGSKKTYGWEKGNPELKEIRAAIKNRGTQAEKPVENKGKKSTKKTAGKKSVKKTEKPGTQDMSVRRQRTAKEVSDKKIKKTGKAPTQAEIDAAMNTDKK